MIILRKHITFKFSLNFTASFLNEPIYLPKLIFPSESRFRLKKKKTGGGGGDRKKRDKGKERKGMGRKVAK